MSEDLLFHRPKVILDTETTGMGKDDEVIQIAIIDYENGDVLLNEYFLPFRQVAVEALKVHGISNESLAEKPTIDQFYVQICDLLQKNQVLIYNSEFDIKLLKQSFRIHHVDNITDIKSYCVMKAYSEYYGEIGFRGDYKWHKLTNALKHQNVDYSDLIAHNAVSDCEMTRRLIHKVGLQQLFSSGWAGE